MSKKYRIVFSSSEEDQRLLVASVKALQSDALAARFGHSVVHDTGTEKTTLYWWHKGQEQDQ